MLEDRLRLAIECVTLTFFHPIPPDLLSQGNRRIRARVKERKKASTLIAKVVHSCTCTLFLPLSLSGIGFTTPRNYFSPFPTLESALIAHLASLSLYLLIHMHVPSFLFNL